MNVAHALLDGLIDYAGLFPPASLDMDSAVRAYADYRRSDDRRLLGRFIVPAAQVPDLSRAAASFIARGSADPWRVSAIAGQDPVVARDIALDFNCRHADADGIPKAVCDAIEMPVKSFDDIALALETFPDSFQLFLEIPLQSDPAPLIARLGGTRASAKMRTGGVVESAIPSPTEVLRFIRACSENGVAFKATAGLHHAIRGEYPLTYEAGAPRGTMYGYLNVFLAAAFVEAGLEDSRILEVLGETDRSAFRFDESGVHWRSFSIGADTLPGIRREFAISFGSCSFVEPVSEAKELNLI